jgi:hypothetical protein
LYSNNEEINVALKKLCMKNPIEIFSSILNCIKKIAVLGIKRCFGSLKNLFFLLDKLILVGHKAAKQIKDDDENGIELERNIVKTLKYLWIICEQIIHHAKDFMEEQHFSSTMK